MPEAAAAAAAASFDGAAVAEDQPPPGSSVAAAQESVDALSGTDPSGDLAETAAGEGASEQPCVLSLVTVTACGRICICIRSACQDEQAQLDSVKNVLQ